MSLEKSSFIDAALFGTINRITVVENQKKATLSIQQQGVGTVTYDLKDKKVYWKRDGVKIVDACKGCLHKTTIPNCLKNPFIQRTLWGEFSNSCACLFKQIQVVGKLFAICEEMNQISFRHPECTGLFISLLKNVKGVRCVKYQRKCVPRWQEGIVGSVTTIVPLGPEISGGSS